jgi:hypothetical protein
VRRAIDIDPIINSRFDDAKRLSVPTLEEATFKELMAVPDSLLIL